MNPLFHARVENAAPIPWNTFQDTLPHIQECCARREEALPCQVGGWNVLSRIKAPTCPSMRGVPAVCPDREEKEKPHKRWEIPGNPTMLPLTVPIPGRKSWIKHPDSSLHPSSASQEEKLPGKVLENSQPQVGDHWISHSLIFLVPPALYVHFFSLGTHCAPNGSWCCRDILGILAFSLIHP